MNDGFLYKIGGNVRPFAREFLQRISDIFEVVTWTASLPSYANAVFDILDPEGKFIHHRLVCDHAFSYLASQFRESCQVINGNHIKNLDRLGYVHVLRIF